MDGATFHIMSPSDLKFITTDSRGFDAGKNINPRAYLPQEMRGSEGYLGTTRRLCCSKVPHNTAQTAPGFHEIPTHHEIIVRGV